MNKQEAIEKLTGELLANAFDSISIAFANMAKAVKRWEEQFDKENSNQDKT